MHGCEQFNSCLRDTVIKKLFLLFSSSTLRKSRTSLVVQWLRHYASIVGGTDSVPGQGTKIPHATLCGKKKKIENKKQKHKKQKNKTKKESHIFTTLCLLILCRFHAISPHFWPWSVPELSLPASFIFLLRPVGLHLISWILTAIYLLMTPKFICGPLSRFVLPLPSQHFPAILIGISSIIHLTGSPGLLPEFYTSALFPVQLMASLIFQCSDLNAWGYSWLLYFYLNLSLNLTGHLEVIPRSG